MNIRVSIITHFLLLLAFADVLAQAEYGGYPPGLTSTFQKQYQPVQNSFPLHSDFRNQLTKDHSGRIITPLFALPIKLQSRPEELGAWYDLGTHAMWRLALDAEDPRGVLITFKNFLLPEGAFLFVYGENGRDIEGAFTHQNNRHSGNFLAGPVSGKWIYIEYLLPKGNKMVPGFQIDKIYKVLDNKIPEMGTSRVDTGFMASYPCHYNANCPEGDGLDQQKMGTVRVMMVLEEGVGWCSGSLMHNTAEDFTPYILTAFHCQYGYTPIYDLWRFDFHFDAPGCEDPLIVPSKKSMLGCERRAGKLETDFLLLEIKDEIPDSYNVYYNGWDNSGSYTELPYKIIHHPAGDIKKVSVENDNLFVFTGTVNWDNDSSTPPRSHLRCELDIGGHQAGSSGGPMFNTSGLIIGQLHGGTSKEDCVQTRSYIGRFSESWDGISSVDRLSDWLDPIKTGQEVLQGKASINPNSISLSGTVAMSNGKTIPNVIVSTNSLDNPSTVLTNQMGQFFLNDIDISQEVEIHFDLMGAAGLGISALDLVLIRNHILGVNVFEEEIQVLAADVNESNTVSAADMVQIRNVLLGFWDSFPNSKSWKFIPASKTITASDNGINLMITGYKVGDVNGSADPGN